MGDGDGEIIGAIGVKRGEFEGLRRWEKGNGGRRSGSGSGDGALRENH